LPEQAAEIEALLAEHARLGPEISARLEEFRAVFDCGDDASIFRELVFCLLTPQSRARSCWAAVERLTECSLVLKGSEEKVSVELKGVRFHHTKARRLVKAREYLPGLKARISGFGSPGEARDWLVANIDGMSYKEASHFLRNIGMGSDMAILDRHVLKNLAELGVIDEVPRHLSPKLYLEVEGLVRGFCSDVGIPMDHLDILLWCRETGEIFK
jgi:N-glycosylase/DNA lyase